MKLLLLVSLVLWAGGILAWTQAWEISTEATLLAETTDEPPLVDNGRGRALFKAINSLEQRVGLMLQDTELLEEASATEAYDGLRQMADERGVDLKGAEGLGLVPMPLAHPAAMREALETIFVHEPARLMDVTEVKAESHRGYKRVKITILCNSSEMGEIVSALAQNERWVLVGLKAAAAPHVALEDPLAGQGSRMAVELTVFVDLQAREEEL